MQSLRLILLANCVLLLNTTYAQTIRRVNNNPDVTGVNVYTTAQAAHDAAVANDILIIEPSVNTYGNLTLTKPLKIYGNGYFLNVNTELKADQRSSILGTVVLATGSSGSSFYGISSGVFNNQVGGTAYNVTNITIERCNVSSINLTTPYSNGQGTASLSNFTIRGNYVGTISFNPISPAMISNVFVSNNIITFSLNNGGSGAQYTSNISVLNNTFYFAGGSVYLTLGNSAFENNLLAYQNPNGLVLTLSFVNVSTSYNASYGSHFEAINGNLNNYDVAASFVGTGSGLSDDERVQIKSGSSLKTAGSAGTEIGAYGGTTPYVVSGIPAIPSITGFNNTATGSNSVPLQVIISVKSNN